jgi:phospholipid/cholesterol/gamma-HCH transport system ATP-binding protein
MNRSYIEFVDVHKAFAGTPVLRGMDLKVARGEILYVIGTSGVGKSVTIKHLVGFLPIDRGEIWFDGARIDALSEAGFYPVRRRIGIVFQNATLFDAMTLVDNVALPLRKHQRMSWRAAHDDARRRLADVYLGEFADRYPTEMSDGMRKRAAIARTLTMSPDVVLYDEPTTGLDPINARRIDRLIQEQSRQRGVTAIVVSHDLPSIMSVADRIAFLYQGRVYAVGTPSDFAASRDPIVQQFTAGTAQGPMETPGF